MAIEAPPQGPPVYQGYLSMVVAENKTGYFGVTLNKPNRRPEPYEAKVRRGGKKVHLGSFATADEAARCIAQTPEGQVAAQRAAVRRLPQPLTHEAARLQAQGLTLSTEPG